MRIPSTQALRALDSFARHGSVWRAADELNLTRSAVSHQLRLLQRDLGFEILERVGKGVALTPRGRRYAHGIHKALTALVDAADSQQGSDVSGPFILSCTPGFASLWLCAHIGAFQALYPDVLLHIVTPRRLDDAKNPDVDLFIAFGDGNWPNRAVEPLCGVESTPLCSPALANRLGGLSRPADLLRGTLLHLSDTEDWSRWLALAKVENPNPDAGIVFSDMNLVMSAAIAGQGIAIGDNLTGRTALFEGRLMRPFDLSFPSPRSYFLVHEHSRSEHPVLKVFTSWIRAQIMEPERSAFL